jgi:hypothetical protein
MYLYSEYAICFADKRVDIASSFQNIGYRSTSVSQSVQGQFISLEGFKNDKKALRSSVNVDNIYPS